MATRFKVNPPTRPDGNERITYTCETCGKTDVLDPESHVLQWDRTHSRAIILENTSMKAWYNENSEEVHYG